MVYPLVDLPIEVQYKQWHEFTDTPRAKYLWIETKDLWVKTLPVEHRATERMLVTSLSFHRFLRRVNYPLERKLDLANIDFLGYLDCGCNGPLPTFRRIQNEDQFQIAIGVHQINQDKYKSWILFYLWTNAALKKARLAAIHNPLEPPSKAFTELLQSMASMRRSWF